MRLIESLFIIAVTFAIIRGQILLDNVPIEFDFTGNVSYTPTTGGAPVPGYKLRVAYSKHLWLGVKFMQLTSSSNYDILVFKRGQTPSSLNYEVTVSDFYMTLANPNRIIPDQNNQMDLEKTSYTTSNDFVFQLYRTKIDTKGQDYEVGQFLRVCFFTSDIAFDAVTWTKPYQACYGFSISTDYISTFVGADLGNFTVQYTNSFLYGGIIGPVPKAKLFVYRPNATLASDTLFIRIGGTISQTVGYDIYRCGEGDQSGSSYGQAIPDLVYSGYQNGQCVVEKSSKSVRISYSREMYTADEFDNELFLSTNICFSFSFETCKTVKLGYLYPRMTIKSGILIYQQKMAFTIAICLIFLLYLS